MCGTIWGGPRAFALLGPLLRMVLAFAANEQPQLAARRPSLGRHRRQASLTCSTDRPLTAKYQNALKMCENSHGFWAMPLQVGDTVAVQPPLSRPRDHMDNSTISGLFRA